MTRMFLALSLGALVLGGCTKKTGSTVSEKKAESVAPKTNIKETVVVEMETSLGNIVLELDAKKAPKTVENFLSYVNDGFYDGTIFHRVIDGFMIQGGGFDAKMTKKSTKPPIVNEASNGLS